jgi:hypothetical protein
MVFILKKNTQNLNRFRKKYKFLFEIMQRLRFLQIIEKWQIDFSIEKLFSFVV